MEYISIFLKNYKRLYLNNIKELTYRPSKPIQLILGSNGCGKSSLLKELSPLPPDMKHDYEVGGVKEIVIRNKGKTFVLKSTRSDTRIKHSFIVDNEELNTSGTRQIQLNLSERYFKINPAVHDVLIGTKGFTSMSVAERKKWFTYISDIDYDYSLAVYKKLSSRLRDVIGTIRILSNKLVQENTKTLSKDDKARTETKKQKVTKMLELLLTARKSISRTSPISDEEIATTSKKLNSLLEDNTESYTTISGASDAISILKTKAEYVSRDITALSKEILNTKDILNDRSTGQMATTSELDDRLTELLMKQDKLVAAGVLPPEEIVNIDSLTNTYLNVYPTLVSLMADLPPNSRKDLTKPQYEENARLYSDMLVKERAVGENIARLLPRLKELTHLSKNKETTCPECKYEWVPGFSRARLNRVTVKYETLLDIDITIKKTIKETKIYLEDYENYLSVLEKIKGIVHANKILDFVWRYVSFNDIIVNQVVIAKRMYTVYREVRVWGKIKDYKERITEINNDKAFLNSGAAIEQKLTETTIITLTEKLNRLLDSRSSIEKELTRSIGAMKVYVSVEKVSSELYSLMNGRKGYDLQQVDIFRNTCIDTAITECKYSLNCLDAALSATKNIELATAIVSAEIAALSDKEAVLRKMVKAISPTEGLIAKGIMVFLTAFTDNLNTIINNIWTYSLNVYPCKAITDNSVDLDYKFPVAIDSSNVVSDVANTSASMNEVIDLAFKIISMKYLGLDDVPLFLDEFGRTMDATHIVKAYDAIEMLANSEFGQIFMVSHFENCYGRFKNADVSILSTHNLNISKDLDYNSVLGLA